MPTGHPVSAQNGIDIPALDTADETLDPMPCRSLIALSVSAALATGGVGAREDTRPFPSGRADTIESCVGGAPIRFRADDRRAWLDAADAAAVGAALTRRYPVLDRDGLLPDAIVLWRKPVDGWLYVTLLANPAKPSDVCFTATFAASRFELTAALLNKYFGAAVARDGG